MEGIRLMQVRESALYLQMNLEYIIVFFLISYCIFLNFLLLYYTHRPLINLVLGKSRYLIYLRLYAPRTR